MGSVGAILGPSLDDFGASLVYVPSAIVRNVWRILGLSWGLGGYLGPPWGYLGSCLGYVWAILGLLAALLSTYSLNIQITYLIEMVKSLSLSPCRSRMHLQKTTMSSDIKFTHFKQIHKSLVLGPCLVTSHQPQTRHPNMFIHTSENTYLI